MQEFLDLLRFSHGDNQGVRFIYPTILLALGEVERCYDFIKWFAVTGNDDHYDWGNPPKETLTEDMVWWYPPAGDIFEDTWALQNVPKADNWDFSHVLALTIIKFAVAKEVKAGNADSSLTKRAVADGKDPKSVGEEQEEMFRRYCAQLRRMNPHILKGIANKFLPFMYEVPISPHYSYGTEAEARNYVEIYKYALNKTGTKNGVRMVLAYLPPEIGELAPRCGGENGPMVSETSPLMPNTPDPRIPNYGPDYMLQLCKEMQERFEITGAGID